MTQVMSGPYGMIAWHSNVPGPAPYPGLNAPATDFGNYRPVAANSVEGAGVLRLYTRRLRLPKLDKIARIYPTRLRG